MTRKEWLENLNKNEDVTFIIAKAVKDESSPMYHTEYRTTPIRPAHEWLSVDDRYVVINPDHPPIDITGDWGKWYRNGGLTCAIITTIEDLYKMYGSKQGDEMLRHYDDVCRNR